MDLHIMAENQMTHPSAAAGRLPCPDMQCPAKHVNEIMLSLQKQKIRATLYQQYHMEGDLHTSELYKVAGFIKG